MNLVSNKIPIHCRRINKKRYVSFVHVIRIFGYTPTIKSGVERCVTTYVATNMQRVVLHRTSVTAKPRAMQGKTSAYISLIAYSTP